MRKNKKLVCSVGVNDLTCIGNKDSYSKWKSMLNRCYSPKYQIKRPTYVGCTVCDEWKTFSNFNEWYDSNKRAGMDLDKDILIRGNKVYGPQFCRFVPRAINSLLTNSGARRGQYKQGIYWNNRKQKFVAQINRLDGMEHIGYYTTEDDAFSAYKVEKEKWIQCQADYHFSIGNIGKDVQMALRNWKI